MNEFFTLVKFHFGPLLNIVATNNFSKSQTDFLKNVNQIIYLSCRFHYAAFCFFPSITNLSFYSNRFSKELVIQVVV